MLDCLDDRVSDSVMWPVVYVARDSRRDRGYTLR